MFIIGTLYIVCVYSMHGSIVAGSEELAIDPMSIFVDSNLYRFCWKPIGESYPKNIRVFRQPNNATLELKVFKDNQFGMSTLCIENKDNQSLYIIPIEMTKSTSSPKVLYFYVEFNHPLGPQLELIKFRAVSRKIHFELKTEFAGIGDSISPICQILLIIQSHMKKTFHTFIIKVLNDKASQTVEYDSSFSLYYTCDIDQYFKTSTRIIVKSGTTDYDAKTTDLQPIIQMPFRRFIKAVWKPLSYVKRYDVAIYQKLSDKTYKCLKIFRTFGNISTNVRKSSKDLPSKCSEKIPVEDLGYFDDVGKNSISVVLDMLHRLKMYESYRFSIFWTNRNGQIMDNYLHFTPLENENSGRINDKFINIKWDNYEDIKSDTSPMDQSFLSKNDINPYKEDRLVMPTYTHIDVIASVTSNNVPDTPTNMVFNISSLHHLCKQSGCSKSFVPFFYALWKLRMPDVEIFEIMQIPMKIDSNNYARQLEFSINNDKLCFDASWKISNYPYYTTPAMFAVEITDDTSEKCVSSYILYCRTCNEIYINDTISGSNNQISIWRRNCMKVYEFHNHYDAIDSTISFSTEIMPSNIMFTASLFTFIGDKYFKSEATKGKKLSASVWQIHGKMITGIICAVVVAGILTMLCACCVYLSRDPVHKKDTEISEDDNNYDQEDDI